MRITLSAALCAVLLSAAPIAGQVVIDRVVSRVNGEVITQSDIRQARLLKLFPHLGADSTDDAIRRALENRALLLAEARRGTVTDPSADRRAAWRRAWQTSLGSGVDLAPLLQRAGMTESGLDDWCRNDLRIEDFLAERFRAVPESDRARQTEAWITMLRARAGLK